MGMFRVAGWRDLEMSFHSSDEPVCPDCIGRPAAL